MALPGRSLDRLVDGYSGLCSIVQYCCCPVLYVRTSVSKRDPEGIPDSIARHVWNMSPIIFSSCIVIVVFQGSFLRLTDKFIGHSLILISMCLHCNPLISMAPACLLHIFNRRPNAQSPLVSYPLTSRKAVMSFLSNGSPPLSLLHLSSVN